MKQKEEKRMTFEIEVKTIRKMCFLITAFILCSLPQRLAGLESMFAAI